MIRGTLLLAGLLALAACSREAAPTKASFRVALLSPGPVSDNGWNASAYEGLLRVEKELGATKAQQEVKSPAEFEEGLRANARLGADLVFGHGFEFGDPALRVAREFPKTAFVVSAGAPQVVAPNVASMVWRVEDAAYLCGRLAARLSKTGKAGCVGGIDIPPVRSAFDGFSAGAKSAVAGFETRTAYVGNWHDIGAAKAQAQALIQQGCDLLFHDADAAGLGVLEAAQQAGILAFGCTRDQASSAPGAVLASAVTDVPGAFVAVAREVKEGRFQGRRIEWTRRDGIVRLVWNPKLESRVPPEVRKEIDELDAKIASGALKIPYGAP
ncbi:MAG TPA: BMP family protein [Planctomycetota bacterium]|nr:BMP family protein [Planctomycetota bacterium]